MIAIVDYGLGNVQAFANMYKRMNVEAALVRDADALRAADRIILPGVGAFDHAMHLLDQSGMRATLDELVLERKVPVLGVCVGMQILAGSSDEGTAAGLGWIPGRVRRIAGQAGDAPLRLPHMGWNDVAPSRAGGLFNGLESDARFYFLHSFYFECEHAEHVAATSSYGGDFACAVGSGTVHGVQFHPEKSHHFGAALLKNFAEA